MSGCPKFEAPYALLKLRLADQHAQRARRRRQEAELRARLRAECAVLKGSSLTGESLPAMEKREIRERVMSGLHPLARSTLGW